MKKAILKTQKIITEKEVFDLLKDRENFKEILQMAFYGLFDLPSYMIKQFIDLGDGFFDLKMHNSGTTHRLIKFKRDIIKSDYYDIKLNYTKSGSIFFANDPDHTMEDSAVPCKTIVLRSTDERFKIEIYFIIAIITLFKMIVVATARVRPRHSLQIEIKDAFSIAE